MEKALTQQPCLHWSLSVKKFLPTLYAPPSSDASGWHSCFPTILRAEPWDPGTKTLAVIGTLFALALPCAVAAYGGVSTGKA